VVAVDLLLVQVVHQQEPVVQVEVVQEQIQVVQVQEQLTLEAVVVVKMITVDHQEQVALV
jgi:hypothetical protein